MIIYMYINKQLLAALSILFFLSACSTSQNATQENEIPLNKTTQATLWVQNSTEYKALTLQSFQTAARMLPLSLEDSFWTASLNQEEQGNHTSLPPAIILDIDETVLDNSPFQARMIKQGKTFNIEDWNAWCNEANAEAVPGAVEFTNYAADRGVAIFYISNRSYEVEEASRKNLIDAGFPVSDTLDNIMSNGEEPGWSSSKIERRSIVENNFRVLMTFGDDLNDFFPAKDITQEQRKNILMQNADKLGRMWFVFPNPVYGSWEDALTDFQDDLSDEQEKEILYDRLDSKN